jgi:hypothetical protein
MRMKSEVELTGEWKAIPFSNSGGGCGAGTSQSKVRTHTIIRSHVLTPILQRWGQLALVFSLINLINSMIWLKSRLKRVEWHTIIPLISHFISFNPISSLSLSLSLTHTYTHSLTLTLLHFWFEMSWVVSFIISQVFLVEWYRRCLRVTVCKKFPFTSGDVEW